MRWLAALILLSLPVTAQDGAAQDGAALFNGGPGLQARLGRADGPLLPAARFSCAGCHGTDGRGGTEGGSQPAPAIDWISLSIATAQRPAYDDAAFSRLLRQGVTPSGRVISARMPRFEGSPQAIAALATHLRDLGAAERQGLSATSITVSLPRDLDLRAAALAAVAAFNADGGAFGRRVVIGDPAFLDLDRAIQAMLPRLHQAEDARLQELLAQDSGVTLFAKDTPAARIAGTVDQVGPHLPAILPRADEIQIVGPSSRAMAWAVATGHDARAAHGYAAAASALNLLRDQGRQPTRTRLEDALAVMNLSPLIQVYRQHRDEPSAP